MLYRTHYHPFLYTFCPFFLLSHPLLFSSSSRVQEMECGFVNSLGIGAEMVKTDEFLVVSGGTHGVSGDDLFVNELLDFSNDFAQEEELQQLEKLEGKEPDRKTECSVLQRESPAPENSAVSVNGDFGSFSESELSFPVEGLESLEWLSHFVEDSFSDYSLTGKLPPKPENRPQKEEPCFTTPVQTKARTKRARTGIRIWPVLSPSFTEPSTSSSSSSSSTTSFSKPVKKQHKKPADGGGPASQPRRCSHCGVTKTPQWRAGPLGSKTLCNACGVRYKSGRLLPEYRPACSPTFSMELHSNNHRKVLEMRRKKESGVEVETGTGLVQPVQNF